MRAGCTRSLRDRARSATTTTCPTSSTRCCSTRTWPTRAATGRSTDPTYALDDAQRDKLDLVCRKLGLDARDAGCSTSAAAGARCRCTPRSTTARRSSASRIAAEQKAFIDARIARARAGRPGRDPAAGLPRDRPTARSTPSLDRDGRARRARTTTRPTPRRLHALRDARADGVLHPADVARRRPHARRRSVHRVVHRPRHVHAAGRRDRRRCSRRPGSRCATSTRCASTTCWTVDALAAQRFEAQLGPGRRAGRRGGRPGVAALPRRRRAGVPDGRMGVDQILLRPARVRPHMPPGRSGRARPAPRYVLALEHASCRRRPRWRPPPWRWW